MLRGLDIRDMLIIDRLELAFQPGLNLLFGTRPFLSGKAREANAGVFMKFAPDQGFEPEAPAAVYRHDAHPGVVSNISR